MRENIILYTRKISFTLLLITVFFAPIFLFPKISLDAHTVLAKQYFVAFSSYLLLFFFIFSLFFTKNIVITKPVILILIFAFLTFLSSFNSVNIVFSIIEALLSFSIIIFFFFTYYLTDDIKSIKKILSMVILSALTISIIGILQYFGYDILRFLFRYIITEEERRFKILATLGNPDYLAGYITPIIIIIISCMLTVKKFSSFFLLLVISLILILTLLFTESRANLLGLIIGIIILFFFFYRYSKELPLFKYFNQNQVKYIGIVLVILVVIGSLLFITVYKSTVISRMKELLSFKIVSGHKERSIFYILANEMIFDHPFLGVGVGMYKIEYTNYIEKLSMNPSLHNSFDNILKSYPETIAEHTHNDFLEIWAERGTPTFLIFIYVLVLFFYNVYNFTKEKNLSPQRRFFAIGLILSMLCYLLHAMVNFPFHSPERALLFWIILSLGFRLTELKLPSLDNRNSQT